MMGRCIPEHQLDIYDDVTLYLITRPKDYDRWCDERFDDGHRPAAWKSVGMVATGHQGDGTDGLPVLHVVICLDGRVLAHEDTTVAEVAKIVAHEATHAAGMILDHVGQEYDGVTEALAYLVGWLVKWVWANLPRSMRHAHV